MTKLTDAQIAAREAEVLGDGPRILPLRGDEMTPHALTIHDRIRAVANREPEPKTLDTLPGFNGTMMRHPALFERQIDLGLQLLANGSLPPRDRELAILRMAWLCQAPYEFGEHVILARDVGIGPDDVEAITEGSTAAHWSADERAILCAVEELYDNAMISDATWAALATRFDAQQLIELPILIGQYQQNAYVQNSIRLALHKENMGLRAR